MPGYGLSWRTAADGLCAAFEEDLKLLSELGVGRDFAPKSEARAGLRDGDSMRVERRAASPHELAPITGALRSLGFSKVQATERITQALEKLSEEREGAPSEEDLLREALATRL